MTCTAAARFMQALLRVTLPSDLVHNICACSTTCALKLVATHLAMLAASLPLADMAPLAPGVHVGPAPFKAVGDKGALVQASVRQQQHACTRRAMSQLLQSASDMCICGRMQRLFIQALKASRNSARDPNPSPIHARVLQRAWAAAAAAGKTAHVAAAGGEQADARAGAQVRGVGAAEGRAIWQRRGPEGVGTPTAAVQAACAPETDL